MNHSPNAPPAAQGIGLDPHRKKRLFLVSWLILLECLRHVVFFSVGPVPVVLDSAEYWRSGRVVAEGDLLQSAVYAPYRTPVYPYYLALPQWLFGDNALLMAVVGQHILVLSTTIITCILAARLTGRFSAGVLCYMLMLPLWDRLWYANAILTESLFTLPWTLGMGLLLWYEERPSTRVALSAGIFLGIATMVRPVPQLLVPFFALLLVVIAALGLRPWPVRVSLKHTVIMVGCFGLVLLPCLLRNKLLYDQFFLTKLPALNKWAVAFREGSGGDLPWPETASARQMENQLNVPPGVLNDWHSASVRQRLLDSGLSFDEAEELMSRVCFDAIRAHPGKFSWRAFKRIGNYWRCVSGNPPYGGDLAGHQGQRTWRIPGVVAVGEWASTHMPSRSLWWNQMFSLFALLAAARLSVGQRHRMKGIVLMATFSYFCILTGLVEIENSRYRMILEPLMVLTIVLAFGPSRKPALADAPEN